MEIILSSKKGATIPVAGWQLPAWSIFGLTVCLAVLCFSLTEYIQWSSASFLLGVLIVPFSFRITGTVGTGYLYGISAVVFSILSCLLPASTILYFAVICTVLFILRNIVGSFSLLPLMVLTLMSPLVKYGADVFSFPVRLWLTSLAGNLLQLTGELVEVKGNLMIIDGNEFSVDPACLGLNMLVVSLLCGMMMVAFYQKRYDRSLGNCLLLSLMPVLLLLNMVSNLIRIIILVQFQIMPDNAAHDWVGVAALLLYVILPAAFLSKWLVKKFGRTKNAALQQIRKQKGSVRIDQLLIVMVLLSLITAAFVMNKKRTAIKDFQPASIPVTEGYQAAWVDAFILKLQSPQSLVYVKKIPGFASGDHHPMICWRGSGFLFRQVEEKRISGNVIYTALLSNGSQELYTAWWYENGAKTTIDQFVWRWDLLTGKSNYSLINVTAATEAGLLVELSSIFANKPFEKLLKGM